MVAERGVCDQPDTTCRHRAVLAGSGPQTVEKAHGYDRRVGEAAAKAEKAERQLAKCSIRNRQPRCPHKPIPVPAVPDQDSRDNGQTPSGDGSRGECEIAQQVQPFN